MIKLLYRGFALLAALAIVLCPSVLQAQSIYYLDWPGAGDVLFKTDLGEMPPIHERLEDTPLKVNDFGEMPDGRLVYTTNVGKLIMINPDGTEKTWIKTSTYPVPGGGWMQGIAISDDYIFFSQNRTIYRVPIDLGGMTPTPGLTDVNGIENVIENVPFDIVATAVGTNTYDPYDMKLDASTDKLYFTTRGNSTSERLFKVINSASGPAPSAPAIFADQSDGVGYPLTFDIDEDQQRIFYVDGSNSLRELDLGTQSVSVIPTPGVSSFPQGIGYDAATDDIIMSAVFSGSRSIVRVPVSGGAIESLASQSDPGSWVLIPGVIVVSSGGNGGGTGGTPQECLVNGGFEEPLIGANVFRQEAIANVPGWNSVRYNRMEFIPYWYGAHPEGVQAIELNSDGGLETIYQDFNTTPGSTIDFSFFHHNNPSNRTEQVDVRFGAPGGTTSAGVFSTVGNGWTQQNGTYTVPAGQTVTRMEIVSLLNHGNGNLLDGVSAMSTGCGTVAPVDTDGDGVPDDEDAFPNDPNETEDTDGDGVGDNGDAFPNDPNETEDTDGDGVGDNGDAFPNDPNETEDTDGDGVGDNGDAFPNDPNETEDTDGDGVGDNGDAFPNDPNETADSDGDGVGDNGDAFPNDPNETEDTDGDGVGDNGDAFPNDPNETADLDLDTIGDNADFCEATNLTDNVGTRGLGPNKWRLSSDGFTFEQGKPKGNGKGKGSGGYYDLTTTGGCTCEQIIVELDLGKGHVKNGCSNSAMADWAAYVATESASMKATAVVPSFDEDVQTEMYELPTEVTLFGNYPNPFNPQTTISFALPETAEVSLVVYDIMGREVQVLVNGTLRAGMHEFRFKASQLPSGTYLYRLVTPTREFSKMMLLLK